MFNHYLSITSPLYQIEIRNLFSIDTPLLANMNLSITNIALYMTIAAFIAFCFSVLATYPIVLAGRYTNHSLVYSKRIHFLHNKFYSFTCSLSFLSFIVLVMCETGPFVILNVLSNDIIRQFLLIEYNLYYKAKIINIFRVVFLLKDILKKYRDKVSKSVYLCSSALLVTRLDILESVSKDIGSPRHLMQEALINRESTGQSISQEVIQLTNAKVRSLQLAYSDFNQLARQERAVTSNSSRIDGYAGDADAIYMNTLTVIRNTIAQVSDAVS